MRGGGHSQKARWGLAHIVRRGADLYLCGHQHLMAHMRVAAQRDHRGDETRCHFAIVGNSSKLEQDEGDFDADFAWAAVASHTARRTGGDLSAAPRPPRLARLKTHPHPRPRPRPTHGAHPVQCVPQAAEGKVDPLRAKAEARAVAHTAASPQLAKKRTGKPRPKSKVTGFKRYAAADAANPRGTGTSSGSRRYQNEWVLDSSLGFATVDATPTRCVMTFYGLRCPSHGSADWAARPVCRRRLRTATFAVSTAIAICSPMHSPLRATRIATCLFVAWLLPSDCPRRALAAVGDKGQGAVEVYQIDLRRTSGAGGAVAAAAGPREGHGDAAGAAQESKGGAGGSNDGGAGK